MSNLLKEFEQYVDNSSWDEISKMVKTYSLEFSQEDKEVKRLKKQIRLTKELLYEYLSGENKKVVKKASFFRGLVKSIELLEGKLETRSAKRSEFLIFLKALLRKVSKEKLKVSKTMERKKGFERLKDAGDD